MTTRIKILAGLLSMLVLLLVWLQLPVSDWINEFRHWIVHLGMLGVVAFVILYVVVMILLGPSSALAMSAGLAYGAWGFPLVVLSTTLAASVAFLIGRYLARERVTHWINRDARLRALNAAVGEQGWRLVGLMRLSPLVPYGVQNYLFSVTRIHFMPYTLATLVGILPVTALYVYIGSLGHGAGEASALQWVLVIGGLLATVAIAVIIARQARAVLADFVDTNTD